MKKFLTLALILTLTQTVVLTLTTTPNPNPNLKLERSKKTRNFLLSLKNLESPLASASLLITEPKFRPLLNLLRRKRCPNIVILAVYRQMKTRTLNIQVKKNNNLK